MLRVSAARGADQEGGRCTDSVSPRKGERVEGRGDEAGGAEMGVGGECEEGAAAKCSGHDNGERFVKLSCSSSRLYSWVRNYPVGRKEKGPLENGKEPRTDDKEGTGYSCSTTRQTKN